MLTMFTGEGRGSAEGKGPQVDDEDFVTVQCRTNKCPNVNGHDVMVTLSKMIVPSSKLNGSHLDVASSFAAVEVQNIFGILAPVDDDNAPVHEEDEHEHEQRGGVVSQEVVVTTSVVADVMDIESEPTLAPLPDKGEVSETSA